MMHSGLVPHYERTFAFVQYHNWSLAEIEGMIPWELDVNTSLLSNYLEKIEMDNNQRKANI